VRPAQGRGRPGTPGKTGRDCAPDLRHREGAIEMSVLVVAEHLRGQVRDVTFELIAAGRELGGPLAVAVIGADPGALNVNRAGVDDVVHVQVEQAEFENDVYQHPLEAAIAQPRPRLSLLAFTVKPPRSGPG